MLLVRQTQHRSQTPNNGKLGIVHGDVKPQNILVMDVDESIEPQVADFGYSRSFNSPEQLITVSRTPPWYAPEVRKQMAGYFPSDAIKTDLFSFGMLCLWALFDDDALHRLGVTRHLADPKESSLSFTIIDALKEDDKLRGLCRDHVRSMNLNPSQAENLIKIFDLTLARDTADREIGLREILLHFNNALEIQAGETDENVFSNKNEEAFVRPHFDFEVTFSGIRV
jgi:serine/threonine protein kinase